MSRLIDLTGKRFGLWTVLYRLPDKKKNRVWMCECDCGTKRGVSGSMLPNGRSISCGCSKTRNYIKYGKETYKRLHGIWRNMRYRCENDNSSSYDYYGRIGISVCDDWKNVKNFVEWSIVNGYSPKLEIDRIDPRGNYCPENCRWVTNIVQQNNRTTNVRVEYNGKIKTVSEWARELNLNSQTLRKRILRNWTHERAFSEALNENKSSIYRKDCGS